MAGEPDYILTGGVVRTQDSSMPEAEGVAVRGGEITAVGSGEQLRDLAGSSTEVIELDGRLVLPAFTDCHIHLLMFSRTVSMLDLTSEVSVAGVVDTAAGRAAGSAPGSWISGYGWDRNIWTTNENPNKELLDAAAPDNPIYLWSRDYHTLWVNQRAIDETGIKEAEPSSADDRKHVQKGIETGLFAENAAQFFDDRIPPPRNAEQLEAARKGIRLLHRMGISSVFSHERVDSWAVLKALGKEDQKLRVFFSLPARKFDESLEVMQDAKDGAGMVRPAWMKIFVDGSLGSRSAEMFEDYCDTPAYRGIPTANDPELSDLVDRSLKNVIPVAVHCIGDKATQRVLSALTKHDAPGEIRNRIEHAQVLRGSDLDLVQGSKAVMSMQPVHLLADAEVAEKAWGDRCRYCFALRSLMSAGALLNFGSDAPVETPNPLKGIGAAVARKPHGFDSPWVPEERISVEDAVKAYTIWAARSVGSDDCRGILRRGYLADIAVLSRDIYEVEPEAIHETAVDLTMVDGAIVHRSGI